MTGFDFFLAALFIAGILIEMKRGFGRAIFDIIALYSSLFVSGFLTPIVAGAIPGVGSAGAGYADCQLTTFLVVAVILLTIARFTAVAIPFSLGMFDNLGGMLAGGIAATIFCHGLVAALAVGSSQQVAEVSGVVSQQLLTFSEYHQIMDGLNSAMTPPADNS